MSQGTARDRRRSPFRPPPDALIALGSTAIREAFRVYTVRERMVTEARAAVAQAERAIPRAKYQTEAAMEQAAREGTLSTVTDDSVRAAEDAHALALRRVAAAENVLDEARDLIIEAVTVDGAAWCAAVIEATSKPAIERARALLAELEEVLPSTTAGLAVSGFVKSMSKGGKHVYIERPLRDVHVGWDGALGRELNAALAVDDLGQLLSRAEAALNADKDEEVDGGEEADVGADPEPGEERAPVVSNDESPAGVVIV